MSFHYDGIWFISFFSTLLTYESNMNRQRQFGALMMQLLVMNLSLQSQPYSYFTIANVIFIALAILSFQLQRMKKNKDDVELLYDQLRKQHYALDEARLQLMDYARKVENIAQTEERNRISHDLHDDLGHKLIRLKMMMEASLSILAIRCVCVVHLLARLVLLFNKLVREWNRFVSEYNAVVAEQADARPGPATCRLRGAGSRGAAAQKRRRLLRRYRRSDRAVAEDCADHRHRASEG